jgi:ankyrin repeat protein
LEDPENAADINNECSYCNEAPLHVAIRQNNVDSHKPVMMLLLNDQFRADLSHQDVAGCTPLEQACDKEDYCALELLLDSAERQGFPVDYGALLNRRSCRRPHIRQLLQERMDVARREDGIDRGIPEGTQNTTGRRRRRGLFPWSWMLPR